MVAWYLQESKLLSIQMSSYLVVYLPTLSLNLWVLSCSAVLTCWLLKNIFFSSPYQPAWTKAPGFNEHLCPGGSCPHHRRPVKSIMLTCVGETWLYVSLCPSLMGPGEQFFNLRTAVLQYCVGFCCTTMSISGLYTYSPSLWDPLPTSPIQPL